MHLNGYASSTKNCSEAPSSEETPELVTDVQPSSRVVTDPERRYHFYSLEQKVDIRRFGSLINSRIPFHVRQGSWLHRLIARFVFQPGETEDYTASGSTLMAGVQIKPAYAGTGYSDQVRYFGDFSSRLYFMEAVD